MSSSFSDILIKLRNTNRTTQKEIARYLCITEQAYQKYEEGKCEPNYNTIIRIADYYKVSVDHLLGYTD